MPELPAQPNHWSPETDFIQQVPPRGHNGYRQSESKQYLDYEKEKISRPNGTWEASASSSQKRDEVTIQIEQLPTHSNYLSSAVSTRTRKPQRGRWNAFLPGSKYRWKNHPHMYKPPNLKSANRMKYRHRDSMARVYQRPSADRYLNSIDGRLTKLMVQTAEEIYSTDSQQHSWRRTYIRQIGPWMLRAAYWPYKMVPADSEDFSSDDKWLIAARWLPACLVLFLVLPIPKFEATMFDNGAYPPFPYKYWGTCKVARNSKEDVRQSRALHWNTSTDGSHSERLLRPRYLMFLTHPGTNDISGYVRMTDEDWNKRQSDEAMKNLPYVFVAYTKDQFKDASDLDELLIIAEKATRRAGLSAFWIGSSCMPDKRTLQEDVYRINDVIRGAHSLVIVLGNTKGNQKLLDSTALLQQWGSRMWTFPEALLSPNDKNIEIYTRGKDLSRPIIIAKKDLPTWAWEKPELSRQLMDNFLGTLTLSRLELVSLAIQCLHARNTDPYLEGDLAYALMGLLRRRPMVDETDSEFQALARLSLANDSDSLLERLICVLPKTFDEEWLRADDAWDVKLWEIYPTCQIAGVGDKDTVILDGCRAAAIKWDEFARVAVIRRDFSFKRLCAKFLVRFCPILIIIGAALASISGNSSSGAGGNFGGLGGGFSYKAKRQAYGSSPNAAAAAILLIVGLVTWLASPYLVKIMYGGKFWDQQAWLFGFEGYADIDTIEALIFGYNMRRLSWSTCGSPLSRHSVNKHGEWVGLDPTDDPEVEQLVENAKNARLGQQRIFTIVDTFTMTVTLIQAVRPPVMVLLCASEGGNQRAVMCSYEWKTQTLYKESVIRMETQVLSRMRRIGRVRFGFFRSQRESAEFEI